MPTYEYRCRTCAYEFEEFQSIADPALTKCPKCGGLIERLISGGGGLLFKGSGFYITDYRSEGYKKAARADNAPTPSTTPPKSGDSKSKK
ncbi:MAG: FmdB family zinc ribbon protein [Candidatus Zixiibacteriota bacterium]